MTWRPSETASVPRSGYLGLAADDEEGFVRWVLAPITNTELKALIDGAETLRDALLKPQVYIVDMDHEWKTLRAWSYDGNQLGDEHLPERGALLPTLTRQELAETSHALPDEPEI